MTERSYEVALHILHTGKMKTMVPNMKKELSDKIFSEVFICGKFHTVPEKVVVIKTHEYEE